MVKSKTRVCSLIRYTSQKNLVNLTTTVTTTDDNNAGRHVIAIAHQRCAKKEFSHDTFPFRARNMRKKNSLVP
jgi:hypothetical protein